MELLSFAPDASDLQFEKFHLLQNELAGFPTQNSQQEFPSTVTYQYSSWMSHLDDSVLIDKINLPGTHDSGALIGGPLFECQSLTVEEQLNSGIRFLDVRCRHINDTFAINHDWVYQNLTFEEVLTTCKQFLNENPSEVILMRIKPEYIEEGCSQTFSETFLQKYFDSTLFYDQSNIPLLGNVRGKIYIFKQFEGTPEVGINWSDIVLQDDWDVADLLLKEKAIRDHYSASLTRDLNKNEFFVNFLSGNGPAGGPFDIAERTNKIVYEFNKGSCGIVVMDYPRESNISSIINLNF